MTSVCNDGFLKQIFILLK